ncbi:Spo0E family sporulation regulatory protein-aspartic acid phosphatase [Clostridium sp. KNHs214]|uniref:Spo0E family sporulation regulatory protein-aspartic acid phosphatase n=1 Tax=Clostridium sp. KNHs214 TaxID=1540257 RepID=UPI000557C4F7|nr:Spo0E family sporulation regulatory protein-aspartic acid phosphatase [Clostridium sp. KNHs214]
MNLSEKRAKLKKQIAYLQNKLNNSVICADDNLGNNKLILKASMELDELINSYMDLLNRDTDNDY